MPTAIMVNAITILLSRTKGVRLSVVMFSSSKCLYPCSSSNHPLYYNCCQAL